MATESILIVEDDNIIAMEIKDRVESLGYHVPAIISFGDKAIAKTGDIKPDLILMDIRLKGDVDGIQAAEKIRKLYDIPVIYLTAYADDNTLQRAKITEPFGYVLKPFEERELASTIKMAFYRHKMEMKLKESEHWLATTLKSIGDGVIATDINGRIKSMNPIAEQLTGWNCQEAIGKDLCEIFVILDEETRETLASPLTKVIKNGKTEERSDHTILVDRDGTERSILKTVSPIKNDNGEISGVVLAFQDNTERRDAQCKLAQQNEYNQLRASLWKLAADKSLSEDELINKMLDFIGPVINVSRVSFSKLFGNYFEDGELKCILEWCEQGVKPSIGVSLPAKVVNFFIKENIIVVDRKTAIKHIPKSLHPVARPIISTFEKKLNLDSLLVAD